MRLQYKVALISGGARGIGAAITKMFAQEGAKLVIGDVLEEEGQRTANEVADGGGECFFVKLDVTSESDWEQATREVVTRFGRLDILVNNAGISARGNVEETSEAIWTRTMDINVKGAFLGSRQAIPIMRTGGGGSIINTASFVALLGAATPQLAYTASKGGVLAMTRELAVIHARQNLRCNALCPGPLHTKLLMDFLDTEQKKQRRLVHIPMGRFGLATEMADAALYLASSESSYVNGTEFVVDGGITAAYVTPAD